jgi:hypothetical protein
MLLAVAVEFLRSISKTARKNRFRPVNEVIQEHLNPTIGGWVNYFRYGNSARDQGPWIRQMANRGKGETICIETSHEGTKILSRLTEAL